MIAKQSQFLEEFSQDPPRSYHKQSLLNDPCREAYSMYKVDTFYVISLVVNMVW